MLNRLKIYPTAYYNYLRHRKSVYHTQKQKTLETIQTIYHQHKGVDGYRTMQIYLQRQGICLSATTVHKYMNTELHLFSVVRRKKPDYQRGEAHKIFTNKLKQNFDADKPNQKWCTDFTYLFLTDGEVRYNCSIIDLYDRSIVASVCGKNITAELAIETLTKALDSQNSVDPELLLHSDQGSQFTSKAFISFCESRKVTQSMSKAGYPYDNAPMERYFNTLKNECTNLHEYKTELELYKAVEEFAYAQYNHVRPHSHNGGKTPFETRYAA